ncbi:uncharacterized protein H6S33_007988 [Morchella sextelata]|uniref:uncharacterized protein n=1 Tax=Morchella sextelata TaxID=1174677 RepID=UPI001D04738B|nr:uncharacterized protein H6S33_007988 [Morchella sextelata]KAH0602984.1 hypothetical protein H6S33_007988 [Morchella sextelata]
MADKSTNHRSPSLAVQEEVAQYFPHIADEPAGIQTQPHGESVLFEALTREPSFSSHHQHSEYGPRYFPAPDTTYFRFNGVEVDTDLSKLSDWETDTSDDSEYDHERELTPQSGGSQAINENIGQEGENEYPAILVATANAAVNAVQQRYHGHVRLGAGHEVNNGQASGQAHVSGFVDNRGYMYPDPSQSDQQSGLIVGPAFSRPTRIGPEEPQNEPFVLGPNAAMLEEHGVESTAAHTAYYGHNLPTRRARCPDGRFRCRVCTYTSGRLQALQRHISTRTGNIRFSCPHCGRRFVRQDLMRIHSRKCKHAGKREGPPDNAPGPPGGPHGSDGDAGAGASTSKAARRKVQGSGRNRGGRRAAKA